MRIHIVLPLFLMIATNSFGQNKINYDNVSSSDVFSYAYITIEGKAFGKKLKVTVDLGDSPEQIDIAKQYADSLTNKKSYAAILNYMAMDKFELVESKDLTYSFQGTGGSFGLVLIMRKRLLQDK